MLSVRVGVRCQPHKKRYLILKCPLVQALEKNTKELTKTYAKVNVVGGFLKSTSVIQPPFAHKYTHHGEKVDDDAAFVMREKMEISRELKRKQK